MNTVPAQKNSEIDVKIQSKQQSSMWKSVMDMEIKLKELSVAIYNDISSILAGSGSSANCKSHTCEISNNESSSYTVREEPTSVSQANPGAHVPEVITTGTWLSNDDCLAYNDIIINCDKNAGNVQMSMEHEKILKNAVSVEHSLTQERHYTDVCNEHVLSAVGHKQLNPTVNTNKKINIKKERDKIMTDKVLKQARTDCWGSSSKTPTLGPPAKYTGQFMFEEGFLDVTCTSSGTDEVKDCEILNAPSSVSTKVSKLSVTAKRNKGQQNKVKSFDLKAQNETLKSGDVKSDMPEAFTRQEFDTSSPMVMKTESSVSNEIQEAQVFLLTRDDGSSSQQAIRGHRLDVFPATEPSEAKLASHAEKLEQENIEPGRMTGHDSKIENAFLSFNNTYDCQSGVTSIPADVEENLNLLNVSKFYSHMVPARIVTKSEHLETSVASTNNSSSSEQDSLIVSAVNGKSDSPKYSCSFEKENEIHCMTPCRKRKRVSTSGRDENMENSSESKKISDYNLRSTSKQNKLQASVKSMRREMEDKKSGQDKDFFCIFCKSNMALKKASLSQSPHSCTTRHVMRENQHNFILDSELFCSQSIHTKAKKALYSGNSSHSKMENYNICQMSMTEKQISLPEVKEVSNSDEISNEATNHAHAVTPCHDDKILRYSAGSNIIMHKKCCEASSQTTGKDNRMNSKTTSSTDASHPTVVLRDIDPRNPHHIPYFVSCLSDLGVPQITVDFSTDHSKQEPSAKTIQALEKYGYTIESNWCIIKKTISDQVSCQQILKTH